MFRQILFSTAAAAALLSATPALAADETTPCDHHSHHDARSKIEKQDTSTQKAQGSSWDSFDRWNQASGG